MHQKINKIAFTGSLEVVIRLIVLFFSQYRLFSKVGKIIQQSSGITNLKRVSLELGQSIISIFPLLHWDLSDLGGKSPMIVCEDADCTYALTREKKSLILPRLILVDLAVNTAHAALFTHAGQVCFAASRIFVHADIHDQFVQRSVELAKQRVVGDPFDPLTKQGPLVDTNNDGLTIEFIEHFVIFCFSDQSRTIGEGIGIHSIGYQGRC